MVKYCCPNPRCSLTSTFMPVHLLYSHAWLNHSFWDVSDDDKLYVIASSFDASEHALMRHYQPLESTLAVSVRLMMEDEEGMEKAAKVAKKAPGKQVSSEAKEGAKVEGAAEVEKPVKSGNACSPAEEAYPATLCPCPVNLASPAMDFYKVTSRSRPSSTPLAKHKIPKATASSNAVAGPSRMGGI
ncbi:hypothetical protein IAR50_002488 [Cryptococcus sp. DSM 104548]